MFYTSRKKGIERTPMERRSWTTWGEGRARVVRLRISLASSISRLTVSASHHQKVQHPARGEAEQGGFEFYARRSVETHIRPRRAVSPLGLYDGAGFARDPPKSNSLHTTGHSIKNLAWSATCIII